MMRWLFVLLLPLTLFSQSSDILLLQKNHRTIRQFHPGTPVTFFTTEHLAVSAIVDSIKRDSIFLLQYGVRMVPNGFGGYRPDTLGRYKLGFSLDNIYSFPAPPPRFAVIRNGLIFMIGGAAYLVLNLVNSTREKVPPFGKDNRPHLAWGAGAVVFGYLLHRLRVKEYRVGKKYQLKYLEVQPPK